MIAHAEAIESIRAARARRAGLSPRGDIGPDELELYVETKMREAEFEAELKKIAKAEAAAAAKHAKQAAEAEAALPAVVEQYTAARGEAKAALQAAVEAVEMAVALRARYEQVWEKAHRLGLDVPVRIPPAALGEATRYLHNYGAGC